MKRSIVAIVGIALFLGTCVYIWAISNNKFVMGYNIGYQPDQPIPFSHKLHAGHYHINCRYCHANAGRERHATVPSLNICMNCHIQVKTSSPWIKKIQQAYYSGKPIEWQKVHLLPDFVKFNHAAHILAGKQCQTCHGPVETMDTVHQAKSLAMGWCIQCHRKPENHAPTTCGTCHY